MSRPGSLLSRIDHSGVPLLVARLALGGLFIGMGAAKIADPVTFLKLLKQYNALPLDSPFWMNATAVLVPWVEVVVGVALLLGLAVRGGGLVAALMLILFTPLIYLRGMELYNAGGYDTFCAVNFNCGCGGGAVFVCSKLLENLGLLVLALIAAGSRSRRFCLSTLLARRSGSPEPRISAS